MELTQYPVKLTAIFKTLLWNKLADADVSFLREYLNKQEQILFYTMTARDQRHSLNVAYAIRELLGRKTKMRLDKLYKAALLHDIGKARGRLRLLDRIAQVFMFAVLPPLANYLAERGALERTGYWRRILYVYKYHPRIGAALAREIKVEDGVAYLIENHNSPRRLDEPKELTILREMDELN